MNTTAIFDLQPVLVGELTRLSPLQENDFEPLFRVASDPGIWEQHPEKNRFEREVFKIFFKDALDSRGAFIIYDKKSDQPIGSSRFYGYEPRNSEILIGYTFLARSHWGGQYNHEIKNLMITHAFRFVDTILFDIGEQNLRSQKAILKIGARLRRRIEINSPENKTQVRLQFYLTKKNGII